MHPISPGLYCGPAALQALTGEDLGSVLVPALNRHGSGPTLHATVTSVYTRAILAVLKELGYAARPARDPKRHTVARWAEKSAERWPGHALLLITSDHVLVLQDGRVYDTFTPHGAAGRGHPYALCPAQGWLVEKISHSA